MRSVYCVTSGPMEPTQLLEIAASFQRVKDRAKTAIVETKEILQKSELAIQRSQKLLQTPIQNSLSPRSLY
jgi:hypothetical protein